MKTSKVGAILGLSAIVAISARSQGVYSINAVGYINLTFYAGNNFVANQLSASPDNTLDSLFPGAVPPGTGGILPGSTFAEWNPGTDQLSTPSVFNGTSWSINYVLSPNGMGGVLNSPGLAFATIVGTVVNVNLNYPNSGGPFYTFVPPAFGPGTYLLSLAAPISGATFQMVVGQNPLAGDSVETLDAATQTYSTTTFNGVSWNNGVPSLGIDQSAYFTLVPEPATLPLVILTAGGFFFRRKRKPQTRPGAGLNRPGGLFWRYIIAGLAFL